MASARLSSPSLVGVRVPTKAVSLALNMSMRKSQRAAPVLAGPRPPRMTSVVSPSTSLYTGHRLRWIPVVFGDERSGHDDVETGFSAALGDAFPGAIDLAACHGRGLVRDEGLGVTPEPLRVSRMMASSRASIWRRSSVPQMRAPPAAPAPTNSAVRVPRGKLVQQFRVGSSIVTAMFFI